MTKLRPLTQELQEIAIKEINEDPANIQNDIVAFKEWIEKQAYLKARTDDQFLLAFLRGCKYSLEKAKSKIDKYYTLRGKYPDVFTLRNLELEKAYQILKTGFCFYLPKPLNDHGPRILLMRSGVYAAEDYPIEDVLRVLNAMQEIAMIEDDYATINGIVFVGDMSKATMAHMLQMTPSLIKKLTVYSENAIPFRTKAQHFLHTPTGFDQIFNIFKPFLSEKQQKRVHLHGNNMEKLHEHGVPLKYLPKEYGGENGSIDEMIDYWIRKFQEYENRFKEEHQFGTDEKLRPGKPIDFDSMFGLDGSFRKLNVD